MDKLIPITTAIIYIVGVVTVLWLAWAALESITGLYMRLRDKWARIHLGERRYHLYLRHMNDFDKYIAEMEESK